MKRQAADAKIVEINIRQMKKQNQRIKKQAAIKEKEAKREKRKDYYFGYVDQIEELEPDRGWEIRMNAIAENTLSDNTFLQELQRLAVASGVFRMPGQAIFIISVYVHTVPQGVSTGVWLNFKIDDKRETRSGTYHADPAFGTTFQDGLATFERFTASINFIDLCLQYFATSDWGDMATVDMPSMSPDIPATALATLRLAFGRYNALRCTVRHCLQRMMKLGIHDDNAASCIKTTLSTNIAPEAFFMMNVGQGATGYIASAGGMPLLVSDFGKGKGRFDQPACNTQILQHLHKKPLILSHWDKDHYNIAISKQAKWYNPYNRIWVTPDNFGETPMAHRTKVNVELCGNLLLWPNSYDMISSKTRAVVALRTKDCPYPKDKNNSGALALVMGYSGELILYPGDANFEYISCINEISGALRIVIATHHGSIKSITPQRQFGPVGSTIPRAKTKNGRQSGTVYYSYGRNNTYGHNINTANPYYKGAGFDKSMSTASVRPASLYDHFVLKFTDTMTLPAEKAVSGVPLNHIVLHDVRLLPHAQDQAGLANLQEIPDSPEFKGSSEIQPEITASIHLDGSKPDSLTPYAIKDEFGTVVQYHLLATTITISDPPLQVACTSDVPPCVLIQCRDIRINFNASPYNLIKFEVSPGDEWLVEADQDKAGQQGNEGYAAGYADIRVARNWTLTSPERTLYSSQSTSAENNIKVPIAILYTGGNGGDGQKGGRGSDGANGINGTDDVVEHPLHTWPVAQIRSGSGPTQGQAGGNGCSGGNAGKPPPFHRSRVLALKGALSTDVITFAVDVDQYGQGGKAGLGGNRGFDGVAGLPGIKYVFRQSGRANEVMAVTPGGITGIVIDGQLLGPLSSGLLADIPAPVNGVGMGGQPYDEPVPAPSRSPHVDYCETSEDIEAQMMGPVYDVLA